FFKGKEFNERLEQNLSAQTDLPTITMTTAVIQALQEIEAKNIVVLTPYPDDVMDQLVKTLNEYGINVVSKYNIPGIPFSEITKVPTSEIVEWAMEAIKDEQPDGLLISCGGLRTIEATEEIEAKLGIPV